MRVAQLFRDPPGDQTRNDIKSHGGGNGHAQAEFGKQYKSGDQCPGNGAQRIDPIQLTDADTQFGRIPSYAANEDWKGAPHQKGRNEQHHGCAEESQREQKRLQATNARIRRYIERTHASKTCEREGPCRSDQKLDPGIQRDRFGVSFGPAANTGTAGGKASHKDGQYSCDRIDGMSEDQP